MKSALHHRGADQDPRKSDCDRSMHDARLPAKDVGRSAQMRVRGGRAIEGDAGRLIRQPSTCELRSCQPEMPLFAESQTFLSAAKSFRAALQRLCCTNEHQVSV